MKDPISYDVAVIGSGIIGLAIAYTAAQQGQKVAIFERYPRASGATIRNFGMIWPIGQPLDTFDQAMRSRETWLELSRNAGFWAAKTGSLILAYYEDEWNVLEEFYESRKNSGYRIELLNAEQALQKSKVVAPENLKGALWSATEVNVDPREATFQIHRYLQEVMNIDIHYNTAITHIEYPWLGNGGKQWQAEQIFICSGSDFETLYPGVFEESDITRCKLQMMRTTHQPDGWTLGPTLAAGLTLQHYHAFDHCHSLKTLKERFQSEMPDYNKYGIHVLISQTSFGEITIGDSHEYGLDLSPFDSQYINQLILDYLHTFARFPKMEIAETWHGIYSKIPGKTAFLAQPEPGVMILTGLSGAGMTLSFGLAMDILSDEKVKLV